MEDKNCDKCESSALIFVKYRMKNDVLILRKQCFSCGRLMTLNYKRALVKDFNSLPEVNYKLLDFYKQNREDRFYLKRKFEDLRSVSFNKSREYYHNVYLKSSEWKSKRDLIMDYFNSECQNCDAEADDVHHLTYNNIFVEKFKDLVPLCRSCHKKEHERKDLVPMLDAGTSKEITKIDAKYLISEKKEEWKVIERPQILSERNARVSALSLKSIQKRQEIKQEAEELKLKQK